MTAASKGAASCVNGILLSLEQGWEPGYCSWPLLEKTEEEPSSCTEARPTSREQVYRRLGPGLSVKAADEFLLLSSGSGFRVVESPMLTRDIRGPFLRRCGVTLAGRGKALRPHRGPGLFRHQGRDLL